MELKNTKMGWNWFWIIVCALMVFGTTVNLLDSKQRAELGTVPLSITLFISFFIGMGNIGIILEKKKVLRGERPLSTRETDPSTSDTRQDQSSATYAPQVDTWHAEIDEIIEEFVAYEEPQYQGKPLSESVEVVARLKRQGKLEEALEIAQGAMFVMAEAAYKDHSLVMEHYVIEVAIILHKMKRYKEEAQTLQEWLDLGLPAPREDFRADIRKRLAKANEQWAKAEGRDASEYTAQWRLLIDEHKAAQAAYRAKGVDVPATGRSAANPAPSRQSYRQRRSSNHFLPSSSELLEPEFIAVDFETANRSSGASACQIAMVKFSNGYVIDRYETYLRPPSGLDRWEFTYLHGISSAQTQHAPTWAQVVREVSAFIDGLPVYAHNARFDAGVWKDLDEYFGTNTRPQRFWCTYQLARLAIDNLPDYKLPTVIEAINPGFQLDHHQATSDAEACGKIVLAIQTEAKRRIT